MKAIVRRTYGPPDVLELQDMEKPTPKDGEVLVKVMASSVNAGDAHLLRGDPFLLRLDAGYPNPKRWILGCDVAGRVEAVGENVTSLQPGDEVFGDVSGCGWGAFAEYVCGRDDVWAPKPSAITFEEAAAVPMAAVTALQGLRDKGRIRSGQKVLINGASGGVGTFAVQIAKSFGAEVTAVCSTGKMEMVRSMGADHVIDYTREDFTKNPQRYDLILAANGYHPIMDYRRALAPAGTYVMSGGTMTQVFQATALGPVISLLGDKKLGHVYQRPCRADLEYLTGLLQDGAVVPVIERRYPLAETADAFRFFEGGHATGKIVITLAEDQA